MDTTGCADVLLSSSSSLAKVVVLTTCSSSVVLLVSLLLLSIIEFGIGIVGRNAAADGESVRSPSRLLLLLLLLSTSVLVLIELLLIICSSSCKVVVVVVVSVDKLPVGDVVFVLISKLTVLVDVLSVNRYGSEIM